ncbi:MAG: hypothetical protein ACUVUG_08495 [Candidatus Aminicenantia bacterium]
MNSILKIEIHSNPLPLDELHFKVVEIFTSMIMRSRAQGYSKPLC